MVSCSGWFPNPEEQQVAPPEGQESMEIQKAEEAEEAEEDPLSQALQEAGEQCPRNILGILWSTRQLLGNNWCESCLVLLANHYYPLPSQLTT